MQGHFEAADNISLSDVIETLFWRHIVLTFFLFCINACH